jgi:hypothetical protein
MLDLTNDRTVAAELMRATAAVAGFTRRLTAQGDPSYVNPDLDAEYLQAKALYENLCARDGVAAYGVWDLD